MYKVKYLVAACRCHLVIGVTYSLLTILFSQVRDSTARTISHLAKYMNRWKYIIVHTF